MDFWKVNRVLERELFVELVGSLFQSPPFHEAFSFVATIYESSEFVEFTGEYW